MKEVDKLYSKHQPVDWTPGIRLRQARKQAGFSQEKIAKHLHLRLSVVEAIENDQYDQIEELVFIRGYLRAYANLLNLSADEIIYAFNQLEAAQMEEEASPSVSEVEDITLTDKHSHSGRWALWIICLIVAILTVFFLIEWYYQTNSVSSNDIQQEDGVIQEIADEII